ncbi:polysaccharide deacetylase family protein [Glaciecola siphonariae]|uniref:Polysaccharide deacetylase family protein n=1 Tax=Glaciecola siphonariae TaxID=521012 RepID=A0ABV9LVZ8_9ALTE
MNKKTDLIFLLSVDTEEEWDWEGPFPEGEFSVENLHKLPEFQSFCTQKGIRPCYFVDYAAAQGIAPDSAFVEQVKNNECELGAHLHPWANPPYFDKPNEANSHVINLPIEEVSEKLDALMALFAERFAYQPKAFRTGRWGISPEIMALLWSRGFEVDSSVYPFYQNEFFSCQGSPTRPYWPSENDVLKSGEQHNILELPVTVGFNRRPFTRANKIHQRLDSQNLQAFKANALLWHSKLLRKIYLSPEVSETSDMIALCEAAIKENGPLLHMYFHSSNLISNGTGFFKAQKPFETICQRIEKVLNHLSHKHNIVFMTLCEAKVYFQTNKQFIAP